MATVSKSLTVAAKSAYSLTINAIPTGSSITPANDIQIWLHCADIWDKTYTTISQVLADASTLLALISSNNAADYMARSTNWASSVCANQTAMGYIGNNDYCANKLLADSTWRTSICNSTYFESVLNVKVPTMTSNTAPSGIASNSSAESGYEAYKAFDGNDSTSFASYSSSIVNEWLAYDFQSSKKIYKIKILFFGKTGTNSYRYPKKYRIEGYNGSQWQTIATRTTSTTTQMSISYTDIVSAVASCSKFRIIAESAHTTSDNQMQIYTMQFYGRTA
jgi:hypothetical protein